MVGGCQAAVYRLKQAYPKFQVAHIGTDEVLPVWFQHQETRDPSFRGVFHLSPPPTPAQANYLNAFLEVQHGFWPVEYVSKHPDPLRHAVMLPIGEDAAFFVGHQQSELCGRNPFIHPCEGSQPGPAGQPHCGSCPWRLSSDASQLKPSRRELACMPMKWLGWLATHLLQPWGINITGKVFLEDPCTSQEGILVAESSRHIWAEINQSGQLKTYCIVGAPADNTPVAYQAPVNQTPNVALKRLDPVLLQSDYMQWSQDQALQSTENKLQLREGIAFSGLPPDLKSRWVGLELDGRVLFFNGQTMPTRGLKRNQEYFQALPDDVSKFFLATVEWAKDRKSDVFKKALAAYNAEKTLRLSSDAMQS